MGGREPVERPTHRRSMGARWPSAPVLLRVSGIAAALTIVVAVLIAGGSPTPQAGDAPDVPVASGPSVAPTVKPAPSESEPTTVASSSGTSVKVRQSSARDDAEGSSPGKSHPSSGTPAKPRAWSARGSYEEGDLVIHRGDTYRALQDYIGEGDPDWIYANSLWVRV